MTPPNHELLQKNPIQLQDAAAYPLILSGPESLTRRIVEQVLRDQGIGYELVLEMDNAELIKQYVEIGLGISIGSDFTLHPEDHDKLGVVKLDHLFPTWMIGMCTLRGKFLGKAVRNFMDTVMGELSGFHPELADWNRPWGLANKLASVGTDHS
jgi:LysR family cys regulon transcriptional activator